MNNFLRHLPLIIVFLSLSAIAQDDAAYEGPDDEIYDVFPATYPEAEEEPVLPPNEESSWIREREDFQEEGAEIN